MKLWIIITFLVSGWMFFLGILVGRGTSPVRFDLQKVETELAKLRETFRNSEQDRYLSQLKNEDAESEFGFYDTLTKTDEDIDIPKIEPEIDETPKPATPKPKPDPTPVKTGPESPEKLKSNKQFTIQVASSPNFDDAERLVSLWKKKGFPAYRTSHELPEKGMWHRVRIGMFKNRSDAESMLEKIRKDRSTALILELSP